MSLRIIVFNDSQKRTGISVETLLPHTKIPSSSDPGCKVQFYESPAWFPRLRVHICSFCDHPTLASHHQPPPNSTRVFVVARRSRVESAHYFWTALRTPSREFSTTTIPGVFGTMRGEAPFGNCSSIGDRRMIHQCCFFLINRNTKKIINREREGANKKLGYRRQDMSSRKVSTLATPPLTSHLFCTVFQCHLPGVLYSNLKAGVIPFQFSYITSRPPLVNNFFFPHPRHLHSFRFFILTLFDKDKSCSLTPSTHLCIYLLVKTQQTQIIKMKFTSVLSSGLLATLALAAPTPTVNEPNAAFDKRASVSDVRVPKESCPGQITNAMTRHQKVMLRLTEEPQEVLEELQPQFPPTLSSQQL